MAASEEYAAWIVANKDKQGTPEFETVAKAYRASRADSGQPKSEVRALSEAETPGVADTLMIGAGRTFDKVLDGMTQMYLGARGEDQALGGLKQNYQEKADLYKPLQEARPWATGIGEALPSMAIPIGGSASTLANAGRLFVAGAAPAALEYGSTEDRAKRAALSGSAAAIGGTVVPRAFNAASSAISGGVRRLAGNITPEAQALYARAQQLGIPVNVAQLGDSKFLKTLQSSLEQIPLTGATAARNNQQSAFNRAVSRTFGEDASAITRDVYDTARQRIGGQFNGLTARNNLSGDLNLLGQLGQIRSNAERFATDDTSRAVSNSIDELLSKADAQGVIPGRAYQALDSQISRLTKLGGEKSMYLGELQDMVRKAMDKSISQTDKAAWQTARSQYKNLKTIRDIVAKDGADGNISPTALMGRLNATQAGKESMARGTRGELGELAVIGRQFVRDPIPNSGTAQRLTINALLGGVGGGSALVNPLATAGLAGSAMAVGRGANGLLNSSLITNSLIRGKPTIRQALAKDPGLLLRLISGGGGLLAGSQLANE